MGWPRGDPGGLDIAGGAELLHVEVEEALAARWAQLIDPPEAVGPCRIAGPRPDGPPRPPGCPTRAQPAPRHGPRIGKATAVRKSRPPRFAGRPKRPPATNGRQTASWSPGGCCFSPAHGSQHAARPGHRATAPGLGPRRGASRSPGGPARGHSGASRGAVPAWPGSTSRGPRAAPVPRRAPRWRARGADPPALAVAGWIAHARHPAGGVR
jgi:hypothetical protein